MKSIKYKNKTYYLPDITIKLGKEIYYQIPFNIHRTISESERTISRDFPFDTIFNTSTALVRIERFEWLDNMTLFCRRWLVQTGYAFRTEKEAIIYNFMAL